ncbi:DUF1661 domain-containing protein [Porphyromonas gulae]|nr:DUF1661 domain-containing protein [Porphyromonas gulae]
MWARDFFDCRAKTKTFTRHVFRAVDQKIFRATIRSDADSLLRRSNFFFR